MADLKIKIKGDASSLNRALNQSKGSLNAFKKQLGSLLAGPVGMAIAGASFAIGAIGTAAVKTYSALDSMAGKLDDIAKASKRSGVGAEEFQFLSFAAKRTGKDMVVVENGMRRMVKVILDAGTGLKRQADLLKALGTSYEELKGLKIEDQFAILANRLSLISDESTQAAVAQELFGSRSGGAMRELIKEIPTLREEFKKLNAVVSKESLEAAEKYADELENIKTQILAVSANSGAMEGLAKSFTALNEKILDIRDNLTDVNKLMGVLPNVLTGDIGVALGAGVLSKSQKEAPRLGLGNLRIEEERLAKEDKKRKEIEDAINDFTNKGASSLLKRGVIGGGGGTFESLGGDISGGGFAARMTIDQEQLSTLNEIRELTREMVRNSTNMTDEGRLSYERTRISKVIKD